MNSLDRRLDRLENPSRAALEGLAAALDHWTLKPGESPHVVAPAEEAAMQEYCGALECRAAAGKRLTPDERIMLAFSCDLP